MDSDSLALSVDRFKCFIFIFILLTLFAGFSVHFNFPVPNLSQNGLYKTCYHGDVLKPLALTTVSASTAALDQIMEPAESSICYETNLSATTMLTFHLKASVPPAEFPSSAMSRGLGAPGCTTSTGLETTTAVISPLKRNFNLCKRDPQHPFSLYQELSRSHAGRPFALGYSSRYKPNTSSSFPPTLVLKGRNTFLAENCKLSRPTVNYPTYSLLIVKDSQKRPSYPDPMVRASRSFLNRISELSSLEGKTIRQEKRLKRKKTPKPPS